MCLPLLKQIIHIKFLEAAEIEPDGELDKYSRICAAAYCMVVFMLCQIQTVVLTSTAGLTIHSGSSHVKRRGGKIALADLVSVVWQFLIQPHQAPISINQPTGSNNSIQELCCDIKISTNSLNSALLVQICICAVT